MIKKITLKNVASYKEAKVEFDLHKRCAFFYGLNGVGKSTLSSFLYYQSLVRTGRLSSDPEGVALSTKYGSECKIECEENDDLLVYNRNFIKRHFEKVTTKGELDGIERAQVTSFALGDGSVDAQRKIREAKSEKARLQQECSQIETNKKNTEKEWKKESDRILKETADDVTAQAARAGISDKMKGLKQKEPIWNKLKSVVVSDCTETIESIAEKMSRVQENATRERTISVPTNVFSIVESNDIWRKCIKSVSEGNIYSSNGEYIWWLQKGLDISKSVENPGDRCECPFCGGDSEQLAKVVSDRIGKEYKDDVDKIKSLISNYESALSLLESHVEISSVVSEAKRISYFAEKNGLIAVLRNNLDKMNEKRAELQLPIELEDSSSIFERYISSIEGINSEIEAYNDGLDNIDDYINNLVIQFWMIQKSLHSERIEDYSVHEQAITNQVTQFETEKREKESEIAIQDEVISENSEKKFDIAYKEINLSLEKLGIDSFQLIPTPDKSGVYTLVRPGQESNDEDIYESLSEGEKTMISFLYFVEQCKKDNIDGRNKIVIIDDPISSMSNLFLFNIVSMMQEEFTKKENTEMYSQVILLTHNLNFYYEVIDFNASRRNKEQELFRIIKGKEGSKIIPLDYDDIQNDYQAYWTELKASKENQNPAILANCMRNIIERFFSFTGKEKISTVFERPELQSNEFESFQKFINNGSHSSSRNVTDVHEFDYEYQMEIFKKLFIATGYIEHYKAMMGQSEID